MPAPGSTWTLSGLAVLVVRVTREQVTFRYPSGLEATMSLKDWGEKAKETEH